MADEDLLAGGEAPDNQGTADGQQAAPSDTGDTVDQGPPPSDVQYPEWVPPEYQAPEKRQELLDALGVKTGAMLPSEKPDFVPDKFWKEGEGLQLESMAKSYAEAERKLHEKIPEPPEEYDIKPPEGVELDDDTPMLGDDDKKVFRELGLDNESAQKLTNHFYESILPVISEANAKTELANLAASWEMKPGENGEMPAEFKQRLGKVKDWADKNLPTEVTQHLRSSAAGVQALYGMMQQNVAPVQSDTGATGASSSMTMTSCAS